MGLGRERKKKLIVAFHFIQEGRDGAAPAGWKCGQCRRQGLETARRCGWLPEEARGPRRIVWVRGRTSLDECPTSAIRPESVEWVEKFLMWKLAGEGDLLALPAREADAYLTLEKEWRETRDGNG